MVRYLYCVHCNTWPELVVYEYPYPLVVKTIWMGEGYKECDRNENPKDAKALCGICNREVQEKQERQ